jgi:hypothetical protein
LEIKQLLAGPESEGKACIISTRKHHAK